MIREQATNRLLVFLRTTYRAVGEAHRTNPRHDASSPARLCWVEGGKTRTIRCRLIDISRAGAALLTTVDPPQTPHARLRLKGRETTPWIESEVLGSEAMGADRHRVRLKFADPCPDVFLRIAVLGSVPAVEAESAEEREVHHAGTAHRD